MLQTADPGDETFDAHPEPAVGHRSVPAEIQKPLERFLG
jgi:hypothetical protein